MSFKKQYLKTKPICKVTFKLSKEEAQSAEEVAIVGDFTDWQENALPMKRLKNGGYSASLNLEKDKEYQFRYLLDNQKWENDWAADAYVPSPVSFEDNSVIAV